MSDAAELPPWFATPETPILKPASLSELQDIVRAAGDTTLVPAAGGTRIDLGNAPRGRFALLQLSHALRGDLQHNADDLTVVVPAVTTIAEVNSQLAATGQWLPIDPPFPDRATVGGVLAVGTGGPFQTRYGLPRDLVLGMTLLRPDGELVKAGGRVVKNVAGYDLMRTWCGSLGTLGIITEVALRVFPRVETVDFEAGFESLGEAADAAERLLRADVRPEFAEVRCGGTGPCTLHLRLASTTEKAARLSAGAEFIEVSSTVAHSARDFGYRSGDRLTVRIASLPSTLGSAIDAFPSASRKVIASPLVGSARISWGELPERDEFFSALDRARSLVSAEGGFVIVERMPPAFLGACDPWGPPPPSLGLMKRLKETYDPQGRFNRGRFIGGL